MRVWHMNSETEDIQVLYLIGIQCKSLPTNGRPFRRTGQGSLWVSDYNHFSRQTRAARSEVIGFLDNMPVVLVVNYAWHPEGS